MASSCRPDSRDGFEIAIICALRVERDAIEALLDEDYEEHGFSYGKAAGDINVYTIGRLGLQNVVLAYMPDMGTISAAAVAANLSSSFHNIKVAFVVGICGAVPQTPTGADIFLGDIIISTSVTQIDFGRQYPNQFIRKKGVEEPLGRASPQIRAFVSKLSGFLVQTRMKSKISTYLANFCSANGFAQSLYPGQSADLLYDSEYPHKHWSQPCSICDRCNSCEDGACNLALKSSCHELGCDSGAGIRRSRSNQTTDIVISHDSHVNMGVASSAPVPEVHFGQIACSNQVMKSGRHRDLLAQNENVIGFEMESAGTWEHIPTVIIKSVCDYADSHKDKRFQGYAAATAASCTKAVLEEWRSIDPMLPLAMKRRNSDSATNSYPVHWTITRSRNTLFTGRDEILQTLETTIHTAISHHDSCSVAVTAIGGQGKSEICLQIAHRLKQLFWGIFWIDVSTASLAENGFKDIAERLCLPDKTYERARRGLADVKQPWLLVLDNADDPNVDYQEYFPTGPQGIVILTSRNPECQRYATSLHIDLQKLSNHEARDLLFQTIRLSHAQRAALRNDADEVANLLQSHALALIQAGSYISRGHCSLREYPAIYKRNRKRLLAYRPTQARSRHGDVYATFEASAEILRTLNEECASDALQLLAILSCCGPSRFPLPIFEAAWNGARSSSLNEDPERYLTAWHISHLPSWINVSEVEWDSYQVMEAVCILQAFSLVSVDDSDGIFNVSMHPLVHAWARDRLSVERQHASWITMGCITAFSFESNLWQKNARLFQAHLQALVSWEMNEIFSGEPLEPVCEILLSCGWLLGRMSDFVQLSFFVDRLMRHLGLDRLYVVEKWLNVYRLAAYTHRCGHKVKDSILMWEQIVRIHEDPMRHSSPGLRSSRRELAVAYLENQQTQEAISLLEPLIQIETQSLAEDDSERLQSEHELARAYRENGRLQEAISLFEHITQTEARILTEDDSERLMSQRELAITYRDNRQFKEAISLFKHVVRTEARTLAEDHPIRQMSQHELAITYRRIEQLQEIISQFEHAIQTAAHTNTDRR